MADPVEPAGTVPAASGAPAAGGVAPVRPRRAGSFRGRFLVVYALLGVALAAAAAGLVVLLEQPGAEQEPAWSAWVPDASVETPVPQQIADHVGAQYHLDDGQQLVAIQAAPPRVQDVPVGAIATRKPPQAGSSEPLIDIFPTEETSVFILCGLGESCSIQGGTPSEERLRLLRREALELALYTFRYVEGINYIVAFLPPAPGDPPSYALFFRRGDLEPELDRPLRTTLPAAIPPLPEQIAPSEIVTIDRLTGASLFRFEFQQLQDGTAVLVLNDPSIPVAEPQPEPGETGAGDTTSE